MSRVDAASCKLDSVLFRWHAPCMRRLWQSTRLFSKGTHATVPSCGIAPLPCTIWADYSLILPLGQPASCWRYAALLLQLCLYKDTR